jgi:signal transduction histidine kinase
MLDVAAAIGQFRQRALEAPVEEERARIYRFLHDGVSPILMATAFLAERLTARLETTQPEVAEEAAEIRRLLGDAFDKMHLLFAPPWSR